MAFTISPNMGLVVPGIGTEYSPNWAQDLNSSLSILDGHNHSAGQGVQIQPNGLNINSDLPFQGNNAITLRSARFVSQSAVLSLSTDVGCIYVVGNELYYNDVTGGHNVQLTSNGSVNATSSGISSGTATASFVSSVLVVNAAANTPANIQAGSLLMGNNSPGTNYLTLSPPAAMPASYQITLPVLPAQTNVLVMSSSGVMASQTYDQIGQNMTAVGANAIQVSTTRSTGSTVGTGGVAMSTSSGAYSANTSSLPVAVPNLSVTITTSGRPVQIMLIPDGTTNGSSIGLSAVNTTNIDGTFFYVYRNGAEIARINPRTDVSNGINNFALALYVPVGSINHVDPITAGTYTYSIQASSDNAASGPTVYVNYAILVAYEL